MRAQHRAAAAMVTGALIGTLAACGSTQDAQPNGPTSPAAPTASASTNPPPTTPASGPATSRAAAVALDHLPTDTTTRRPWDPSSAPDRGDVGAELSYLSGQVAVTVVRHLTRERLTCDAVLRTHDDCTEVDGVVLAWQDEEPEEDPGVVYAARLTGMSLVTVSYAGSQVSGNPSATELELGAAPVTGADLVAVAADPRLEFTMSGDVLRAGEELTGWSE